MMKKKRQGSGNKFFDTARSLMRR